MPEFSTTQISASVDDSYERLMLALNILEVSGVLQPETADAMRVHIQAIAGGAQMLAARALTPEDIIG